MRPYYYLGGQRALTQLALGQPFFINTRDQGIAPWIILGGTWENFVDGIIAHVTRAGDRVLDAGASQGYYTVRLGTIVGPEGRIVAFEPNPELFELLESNVEINGFRHRSQIFCKALGAAPGKAELLYTCNNMGGGSISPLLAAGPDKITVDVVRGDDMLPPDCVFDVMKFDVEGFEPEAAEGLSGVLKRSPDAVIVLEVSAFTWGPGDRFATILSRFKQGGKLGFEIGHDGMLTRLDLDDPKCLARLLARADSFYMLLVPETHWAIDFVSSKVRRALE